MSELANTIKGIYRYALRLRSDSPFNGANVEGILKLCRDTGLLETKSELASSTGYLQSPPQGKPASGSEPNWIVNGKDIIQWPKDHAIWGSRAAMEKIASLERQLEQLEAEYSAKHANATTALEHYEKMNIYASERIRELEERLNHIGAVAPADSGDNEQTRRKQHKNNDKTK